MVPRVDARPPSRLSVRPRPLHRRLAAVLTFAAAVLVVGAALAWRGAERQRSTDERPPTFGWMVLAVAGVAAAGALHARRLSAALRASDAARDALAGVVRRRDDEIRLLYERSPRAAWIYDRETLRFLSVNGAAERLYGWSRDELLARTVLDLVPAEDRAAAEAAARAIAAHDETSIEAVLEDLDGRRLDVALLGQSIEYAGRAARLVLVDDVTRERAARRAVRDGERRLLEVLEALDEGVILLTERGVPLWNSAAERVLGLTGAQVSGRDALPAGWRLRTEDGSPLPVEATAPHRALATGRRAFDEVVRLERPDGTHAWLAGSASPISDTVAGERAVVATIRDVSVPRVAARAVAESESRFRGILENLHAVAVCLDLDGCLTFANPFAYELSGWTDDEVLGEEWFSRFLVDPAAGADAFGAAMAGESARYEAALRTRDGRERLMSWDVIPLSDADGRVGGVAALGQDVTDERAAGEALRALSERDPLTGLLNRRGFEQAVARTQRREGASRRVAGLLAIDLDGFKPINDTHGHAAGDVALRAVGDLLADAVRGVDHAGRVGGDEFVIYLADLQQPSDLARVVARLERTLAAHNEAAAGGGRPYRIAWSVGAVLREPGEELTAMLARADAALYREKRARGQGRAA